MEKKEKKGKKLLDEIKDEFKRHTNVLIEEMRSTVKTVTEQHSDLVKKLDKMGRDIDDLKSDMAIVRPAIKAHTDQLREIRSELETVKIAIKDVDARLVSTLADYEKRLRKLETV